MRGEGRLPDPLVVGEARDDLELRRGHGEVAALLLEPPAQQPGRIREEKAEAGL